MGVAGRARGRSPGVVAVVALVAVVGGCNDDTSTSSARAPVEASTSSAPTSTSPASTNDVAPATSSASTTGGAPAPSSSPGPSTSAPPSAAPRSTASALGFGEIAFTVVPAGGSAATAAERCALLADDERQHARGLMGFRDLAGYDGMIFRFAFDTSGPFYMRNVPVGLSIAWFTAEGRFVSSTDMAPCPDQDGCPTYAPAGRYRFALEVLQGGLGRLGVSEGSMLIVGGPCRPQESARG